jgi:zinc-ribbon domain
MVACASCGTANPDGARFCMACATAMASLDPAPANLREERRVVTILSADLAGFTARAEALDPEDVRAFLHPWYALVEREVTGHGGVVERHLGDGVMAGERENVHVGRVNQFIERRTGALDPHGISGWLRLAVHTLVAGTAPSQWRDRPVRTERRPGRVPCAVWLCSR